jgi:hypothetical protein
MTNSLSNKQQIFKSINIEDIYNTHLPIPLTYKNINYTIYTTKINDFFFIHGSNLCFESYRIDKWKRKYKTIINKLDVKYKSINSVYSDRTFGTWIRNDLFKEFFDWIHEKNKEINKNNNFLDFGKYFQDNITTLYNNYIENIYPNDIYFVIFNNKFIRRNPDNDYICITDIFKIYNVKMIDFVSSPTILKKYKDTIDTYYISGNQITDYFNIKVSWMHPELALDAIEWLFKKLDKTTITKTELNQQKQDILDFINLIEDTITNSDSNSIEQSDNEDEYEYEEDIINFDNSVCLDPGVSKTENTDIFKNYTLILPDGETTFTIPVREDGYINVTQLCKAGNREFKHWNENIKHKEYVKKLSKSVGISADMLLQVKTTGKNEERGTWAHRKLAIYIAYWVSNDFAIQVSNWIDELLLTGKVELGKEKSSQELDNIYISKIESQFIEMKQNYNELLDKHNQYMNKSQEEYRNAIQCIENFNKSKENYDKSINENMLSMIQLCIDEFNYERQENDYDDKNVLYMAYIKQDNNKFVFKFGQSSDFNSRELSNKRTYDNFQILCVFECSNCITCERQFREYVKNEDRLYDQKNHKELFYVLNKQEFIEMRCKIKKICKESFKNQNTSYNKNYDVNENILRLKNEEKILDLFAEGKLTSQQLEMLIKK